MIKRVILSLLFIFLLGSVSALQLSNVSVSYSNQWKYNTTNIITIKTFADNTTLIDIEKIDITLTGVSNYTNSSLTRIGLGTYEKNYTIISTSNNSFYLNITPTIAGKKVLYNETITLREFTTEEKLKNIFFKYYNRFKNIFSSYLFEFFLFLLFFIVIATIAILLRMGSPKR